MKTMTANPNRPETEVELRALELGDFFRYPEKQTVYQVQDECGHITYARNTETGGVKSCGEDTLVIQVEPAYAVFKDEGAGEAEPVCAALLHAALRVLTSPTLHEGQGSLPAARLMAGALKYLAHKRGFTLDSVFMDIANRSVDKIARAEGFDLEEALA